MHFFFCYKTMYVHPGSCIGFRPFIQQVCVSCVIMICILCLKILFLQAEELAIANLKRALEALNTHLATTIYLVGDIVALADIEMTCNLCTGFTGVMTKNSSSQYPHVERYFWTLVNQPNFCKVTGEVKQTQVILPVPAAKKPALSKESKPKEAEGGGKQEPAKPSTEEEEASKPKAKNPLDLLQPSEMILDEWKRLYFNLKTNFREVAIKGF
ncbi:elongation factor 1-gamma-like isoform X2 [Asparagus officinalis]|uniref:elongation factor 1-gamma-like isoform X2 n=1 Tax=Asparagus officinalis TaxID=4686 RepID=UPI00098E6878|nr:elongation factor 1-gamma-like isoform X2 [Asparagus officinalis]